MKTIIKQNVIHNHVPYFMRNGPKLNFISKITVLHRRDAEFMAETLNFMKKLLPAIRFNNDDLEFERTISEHNSPVLRIFDLKGELVEEIGAANLKDFEIQDRIQKVNKTLAGHGDVTEDGREGD